MDDGYLHDNNCTCCKLRTTSLFSSTALTLFFTISLQETPALLSKDLTLQELSSDCCF